MLWHRSLRQSGLAVIRSLALIAALCVPASSAVVDPATLNWIQSTLDQWDKACRKDIHIDSQELPWIIFFNRDLAWHVNPDLTRLPSSAIHTHTVVLFGNRKHEVLELKNNGGLWVPGSDPLPVRPQTVAMLYGSARTPFFISASPAFEAEVSQVGPDAMEDLRSFMTSADMHELTHTLQLPYVAKQMEDLQAKGKYPEHLNDNLIEDEFKANEEFRKMRDAELQAFSAGVMAQNRAEVAADAAKGIRLLDERWKHFFVGKHAGWGPMEDMFLALEGSAMWVQYQTALRLAPPKQPAMETLRILSQRTDAWSQTEGLGLFLLIDKLDPGWQKKFFGGTIKSAIAELRLASSRTD